MGSESGSVILCPGQGAQVVGMGKAWAQACEASRNIFALADQVLGTPLSQVCFEGPEDTLNRTDVSQPAIFVASVASFLGWLESENIAQDDLGVAATAGLSLGEYTALYLARSISFEDTLRLVAIRGAAMQAAAEATESGMVALVGVDEAQANEVCDEARGDGVLVTANFNAPGQVVVSGDSGACDRAESVASDKGFRSVRLPVAGAFHSPIMQPAADKLREALEATEISAPVCPVMSNVTAQTHENDPSAIRERLVEQLTSPVRWAQCCEALVGAHESASFHELAPGKSLAGMMKRISRGTKVVSHNEPVAVS